MEPKCCAIIGAKGGTSKTASAAALADLYATAGLRVALVDADPQGTLTRRCGIARAPDPVSAPPAGLKWGDGAEVDGVQFLPGGRVLEAADEAAVKAHLERAQALDVDLVLVDTPPTLGPIVRAAMRTADLIVIPCPPGIEGIEGVGDMRSTGASIAPDTGVRAFIALANRRSRILRWTRSEFAKVFPSVLYDPVVPFEVAATEAAALRLPVTRSAPRSRSAMAYRELAQAIARDLGLAVHINAGV